MGQNVTDIAVANLFTTEPFFDHFVVEMHTDTTGTNRVGVLEAQGVWDVANSRFLQTVPRYFMNAVIGTTYYFRSAVADKYGNVSAWSAWISVVAGDSTAPTQTYSATALATFGGIRVSANPQTPSSDTDHYEFFWNTTNTAPTATSLPNLPQSNDGTAHIIISGSEDAFVWVRAVDTSGNRQAWASLGGFTSSGAAVLTPPVTAPGAPTGLAVVAGQGEFFFSWAAPTGATNLSLLSYTLQTATDSAFTQNVVTYPNLSVTSMQVHKPASTLFWRVQAQYPNSPAGAWAAFGAPTSVSSSLIILDNDVLDGNGLGSGTYGRVKLASLTGGQVDLALPGVVNRTLDNIADTGSRVALKATHSIANVAYNFKGAWSSATAYVVGDETTFGNIYWIALVNNSNSQPAIGNANWQAVGRIQGDVQIFTASGVWSKPAAGAFAVITVMGGGCGGDGGDALIGSDLVTGGGTAARQGGYPGGYSTVILPLSVLGSTETVTVGAGGAGGNGATVTGTPAFQSSLGASGSPGASGGDSSFGNWLRATGGTRSAAGIGNVSAGGLSMFAGAGGSGTGSTVASGNESFTNATVGANGATGRTVPYTGGATGGTARTGGAGQNGQNANTDEPSGGGGGGGGDIDNGFANGATVVGGVGGNGGNYGAGGGGGGGGLLYNGSSQVGGTATGGNGGKGADGLVAIAVF